MDYSLLSLLNRRQPGFWVLGLPLGGWLALPGGLGARGICIGLVLVALALFGGEMIHGFAIALIVGVAIGTYSSIYVAANALLILGVSKEDLMIPVKEGAEQEDIMP